VPYSHQEGKNTTSANTAKFDENEHLFWFTAICCDRNKPISIAAKRLHISRWTELGHTSLELALIETYGLLA
jgi:hypothetical protein